MYKVTTKGRILARNLGVDDVFVCSLIARSATTHQRRQEEACSYTWANGNEWDAAEGRLEGRIADLVSQLGPGFSVEFQGDPRGYTVKITTPDGRTVAALEPLR